MLATANDVPALLGRSHELRAFFDAPANAAASECHALLGARLEEKNVLGTALVGETLQREVAQKQVNFSGQRLIAPAADLLACRREVGTRILRRLAALVLERIESNAQRVKELDERKVVLGVRLRMLTLHRGGLESLAGDAKDESAEIQKIERALEATVDSYVETKGNLATLEGMIGLVNEVYGAAAAHIALAPVRRRLSRMGIVVPAGSTESATDLEFPQLSIGEGMRFVMTFVRVPRAELPPKEDLVKNAARYL